MLEKILEELAIIREYLEYVIFNEEDDYVGEDDEYDEEEEDDLDEEWDIYEETY